MNDQYNLNLCHLKFRTEGPIESIDIERAGTITDLTVYDSDYSSNTANLTPAIAEVSTIFNKLKGTLFWNSIAVTIDNQS